MFASTPVIGVKPAEGYQFRILCTPVGQYFKGGVRSLHICVSDYDRAAPHGTGHIKAGLNYAMSLHAYVFVTEDGELVIPKSDSILPSITRRSVITVAGMLGIKVTERPVKLEEIGNFVESGLCGTAAVISPVGKITDHGKEIVFRDSEHTMGPVTKQLYDTLTGMQHCEIEAPEGWIHKIM